MNFFDWLDRKNWSKFVAFVPLLALTFFLLFNRQALTVSSWKVGEWSAAVLTLTYIILLTLYLCRPPSRFSPEDLEKRWRDFLLRLGSLVESSNGPSKIDLMCRKKVSIFKVEVYDTLNWVDYFYLRLLSTLRNEFGFLPIILLADVGVAHRAGTVPEPQKAARELLERDLNAHLGKPYRLLRMSTTSLTVSGESLVSSTRPILEGLLSQFSARDHLESSLAAFIVQAARRCAKAVLWVKIIQEISASAEVVLICQWAKGNNYLPLAEQRVRFLLVQDFQLGAKDGKTQAPGRDLHIDPSSANRLGFGELRAWVGAMKGRETSYGDIICLCQRLRGAEDLTAEFHALDKGAALNRFLHYFPEYSLEDFKPSRDEWFKYSFLLADSLWRIDQAVLSLRPT